MLGSIWSDMSWDAPEMEEAAANAEEREEWNRALTTATALKQPTRPLMPDEFAGRLGLYPFRLRPKELGLGAFCGELKTAGLIASVNLDSLKVLVTIFTPIEQGDDMEIMTLAQVGYESKVRLDEMTVFPSGGRQYRFY